MSKELLLVVGCQFLIKKEILPFSWLEFICKIILYYWIRRNNLECVDLGVGFF